MFKKFLVTSVGVLASLALGGQVYAAKQVSVRIEDPKSPTSQTSFNINFVAQDLQGRTVTVKCFKQAPSEAGFTQFSTDQILPNGGNSGNCDVNGIFGAQGTYTFKVEATAGDGMGDNFDADTTSVVYDNSGPGDVRDYNKSKNACEYKIHFKTAEDSGATVKVELYRSETVPFNADSGTRIQTIPISSNTDKDTTDTPPDCSKTYYYAVRAFDAAGNGSGLVGDTVTTLTVITPTPGQAQGAIPATGEGGSVLGQQAGEGAPAETGGETLGETSPSAEVVTLPKETDTRSGLARRLAIGGGILALGVFLYALLKKRQNPTV